MVSSIFLLGGYGNTGKLMARMLVERIVESRAEHDWSLVLAGRNVHKAQQLADELNSHFQQLKLQAAAAAQHDPSVSSSTPSSTPSASSNSAAQSNDDVKIVSARFADASQLESLQEAVRGCKILVSASSTSAQVANLVNVALTEHMDFLDLQLDRDSFKFIKSKEEEIVRAGLLFLPQAGFHPGLPAAMVDFVRRHYLDEDMKTARVCSLLRQDWREISVSDQTLVEFAREISQMSTRLLHEGQWIEPSVISTELTRDVDFGDPFGKTTCYPLFLDELTELPDRIPSLRELGFFVSTSSRWTDWVVIPTTMLMLKLFGSRAENLAGKWMERGFRNSSTPPFGAILRLDAEGVKDGKERHVQFEVRHEDAYVLTAICAVAVLFQYMDGSLAHLPLGVRCAANAVDSTQMITDLQALGATISTKQTEKDEQEEEEQEEEEQEEEEQEEEEQPQEQAPEPSTSSH